MLWCKLKDSAIFRATIKFVQICDINHVKLLCTDASDVVASTEGQETLLKSCWIIWSSGFTLACGVYGAQVLLLKQKHAKDIQSFMFIFKCSILHYADDNITKQLHLIQQIESLIYVHYLFFYENDHSTNSSVI